MIRRLLAFPSRLLAALAALLLFFTLPAAAAAAEGGGPSISAAAPAVAAQPGVHALALQLPTALPSTPMDPLQPGAVATAIAHVAIASRPAPLPWALLAATRHRRSESALRSMRARTPPTITRVGEMANRNRLPTRVC